jgi:hypothetical protein
MADKNGAARAFRWAVHAFRYARDRWPALRFHLWGVASDRLLDVLPAWSADASGQLCEWGRFGCLRLFNPATGRRVIVYRAGKSHAGETTVHHVGSLLRRSFGVTPDELAALGTANRGMAARVVAASVQQYAAVLQRRYKVTPPVMYAGTATVGPTLHCADGSDSLLGVVAP